MRRITTFKRGQVDILRKQGNVGATNSWISMLDLTPNLFGIVDVAVSPSQRSRVTNSPARRQKGTTAAGRRLRDLYVGYIVALGHPTDVVTQANCLKAAELALAAENARAQLLAGKGDANAVVRLENLADRAIRRLGLPAPGTSARVAPLRERLAAKAAAGAAADVQRPVSLRERLAAKPPGDATEAA